MRAKEIPPIAVIVSQLATLILPIVWQTIAFCLELEELFAVFLTHIVRIPLECQLS